MELPTTKKQLLALIAAETAKMSYPGSMSRYPRPVVRPGTKKSLSKYFIGKFPIGNVWTRKFKNQQHFDEWHSKIVDQIANHIRRYVVAPNKSKSVAAKFLNTFLHQLMKYKQARHMYKYLHLPLDRKVFDKLKSLEFRSLTSIKDFFKESPYQLKYDQHIYIQTGLSFFVRDLNNRGNARFRINSRIELNWLWLD